MVEIAEENNTPSEMTFDMLVLSSTAPLRAVDATTPAEVVVDRAVEVMPERDVWLDRATLEEVEMTVASDWPEEIWLVCELAPLVTDESVVDSEVSAEMTLETDGVIVRFAGSAALSTFVWGYASRSRTAAPNAPAMTIRDVAIKALLKFGRRPYQGRTKPVVGGPEPGGKCRTRLVNSQSPR